MSRRKTALEEAAERADADQAQADAEVNGTSAAADDPAVPAEGGESVPKPRKARGDVMYTLWGRARSNGEWDYLCDQRTIGQARRFVAAVWQMARKTYDEIKVTRTRGCGLVSMEHISIDAETLKQIIK